MQIRHNGVAGTLESSDIMITLEPYPGGRLEVDLESSVEKQFGQHILRCIETTLMELGIREARVRAVDKGALDCTIRARVRAAASRACEERIPWGGAQ